MNDNIRNISEQRRQNSFNDFRDQSVTFYRKLELLVLRKFQQDQNSPKFSIYINKINSLLDNIKIAEGEPVFKALKKETEEEIDTAYLSSGESELISLGIELLTFSIEIKQGKENFFFLDEPDVHLHPDLQVRLMCFLKELVQNNNFKVIIATHSTTILSALEPFDNAHLAFLNFGEKTIDFHPVSAIYRKILPVFGAHPLSNVFNEAPVLLVEGEDDERIWQQVIRSSNGKVRIYPCSVDGIKNMHDFERETQKIIQNLYDEAKGYSLRDCDDEECEIENLPPIIRMRLSCRASENLLLSDEVLAKLKFSWDKLKAKMDIWLERNSDHVHHEIMDNFKNSGYDRKSFDIKDIRNDIMGIIGSEKPWEVVVGQTIASTKWDTYGCYSKEGKLGAFLGRKVVENLLHIAN